jgi:hypothetical protein
LIWLTYAWKRGNFPWIKLQKYITFHIIYWTKACLSAIQYAESQHFPRLYAESLTHQAQMTFLSNFSQKSDELLLYKHNQDHIFKVFTFKFANVDLSLHLRLLSAFRGGVKIWNNFCNGLTHWSHGGSL